VGMGMMGGSYAAAMAMLKRMRVGRPSAMVILED